MRPDEHKKKRSAQYQRKHGGASSGAKGEKSTKDKQSSKSGKTGSARVEKPPQTSRSNLPDKKVHSSTSESEDEGNNAEMRSRTFRRREIVTNWTKYDMPVVDANDTGAVQKGQDFNKLLLSSGSAVAHFRFKDEESWEGGEANAADAAPQVLSLDCSQLADSLDCLPLYTQLRLDTDIFTSEQLAAMDKTANHHRKQAGLPTLSDQKMNQNVPLSVSEPPSALSGSSQESPGGLKASTACSTLPVSADSPQSSAKHTENGRKKSQDEKMPIASHLSGQEGHGAGEAFTDADLDSLLESADSQGSGGGEGASAVTVKEVSAAGGEVTEQDLDDLLAMESPQRPSQVTCHSNQQGKESSTTAESAELEDWLDSVLDS